MVGQSATHAFGWIVGTAPANMPRERWPPPSLNVWLGARGVLATPHYDPSHNVVVQLIGKKRWLLWPPAALPRIRLHPAPHPSHRWVEHAAHPA